MMILRLFIVYLFLFSNFIFAHCSFDESFTRYGLDEVDNILCSNLYSKRYNLAKDLYNKNIDKKSNIYGSIPKIIHQIWLGNPMPEMLVPLTEKWKNLSDWEYKLWTEKEIESLEYENKDLYEMATNYGEKTDIVRLEILRRYGGVYVDTDYEYVNISNLERMVDSYDIIFGFEPISHGLVVGNAFIGVAKDHPFINCAMNDLRKNFFKNYIAIAMTKTGPYFITDKIFEKINLLQGGIILPPTYIYPLSGAYGEFTWLHDNWNFFIGDETIGIHYWTTLWKDFKQIRNLIISKQN